MNSDLHPVVIRKDMDYLFHIRVSPLWTVWDFWDWLRWLWGHRNNLV